MPFTPRRQHALAALILLLLALVATHRLAFSDWIMARGDTYSYHYPYWQARAEIGLPFGLTEASLWADGLFAGVPLLANPQVGLFYPPNWAADWLAATPADAVRLSTIAHLFWAGLGAYALARRALSVGWLAGLLAGAAFMLGGHLGAHVEQVNQLQGLSWLPWAMWLFEGALNGPRRAAWAIGLAGALALQVFSGHTQTVFLTGAALGLAALCTRPLIGLLSLAGAGALAVGLALPQLGPTLELAALGNRSGGFTLEQATAFSFSPFALGRGLLPSFDRMIFSEYIAYPGLIVAALAWVGAWAPAPRTPWRGLRRWLARPASRWIVLAVIGLALAFGIYNPIYAAAYWLPGFSLFRVPARWLALFALGVALLAALGFEAARTGRIRWVALFSFAASTAALAALAPLIARTLDGTPAYPAEMRTLIAWGVCTLISLAGLAWIARGGAPRAVIAFLAAAGAAELLLAGGALAYNQLVSPDMLNAERFSISQLQAYLQADADPASANRLLSLSDLLFDPGDRPALDRRFDAIGLMVEARATAFDTIKLREVIGGNLPLLWGVPSFDGFDGGLLPTRAYSAFTSLMLPGGEMRTLDGRLRESLYNDACGGPCVPDQRWLNLAGIRYLLTDKVYDLVRGGVFFDTAFARPGQTVYPNPTGFTAEAVDVVYTCPGSCEAPLVAGAAFSAAEPLDRYQVARYLLPAPAAVAEVSVTGPAGAAVRAVSLVADLDAAQPTFAQLVPPPFRRLLSSDIKLYENEAVLPRAFFVEAVRCVDDDPFGDEFALEVMRSPAFDPARTAVLAVNDDTRWICGERLTGADASGPRVLVMATAHYPGWQFTTTSGETSPVLRADVLFQAVPLRAGQEVAEVRLVPTMWATGPLLSALLIYPGTAITLIVLLLWRRRTPQP